MEHPFAITPDAGTSSQPHWFLAHLPARLRGPLASVQPCLPGRREHPGLVVTCRNRRLRGRVRVLTQDNPLPAVMGRVCYHPCETACNRAQIDEAVGINSVERFLGDEAIKQGWSSRPPKPKRQTRARRRRRALRLVGCLPPAPSGTCRGNLRGRADRRRDDALRHSEISAAAGRSGCGDRAHSRSRRDPQPQRQGGEHRRGDDDARLRRGVSRRRSAIAKRAYIPAGEASKILDAVQVLRSMEGEAKPLLGRRVVVYGGGNTALDVARTAKRLGATDDHRLPPHPRPHAGP